MNAPLLNAKFRIPSLQPDLVPRSRLIEHLDNGRRLGHCLTLVAAPAGFGKTTLVRSWIQGNEGSVAWVSLDEDDNDPAEFWHYMIAALQTVCQEIGYASLSLLQSPQPLPPKALLTPLVNELAACPEPVILVLDDYHVIANPEIHAGIAFLLDYPPQGFNLALSTRADPPLPVGRLRARSSLTEIRAEDLRFTAAEASAFLNEVMGLGLSPRDIGALEARTEGWIVGLQLAAISMRGRNDKSAFIDAFSGGHYYILEYLTGEVLDSLPRPLRRFTLQTCVLDRLSADLCDALIGVQNGGANNGEAMLAELQHKNLFLVPLDDERQWFRYHHLFKDLLANCLHKEYPEEHVLELYRRASLWYTARGEFDPAVKYALQSRDFELAASLIERAAGGSIARGRVMTLLRWIEALPESLALKNPRLRMFQGYAIFLTGQVTLAREVLQDARRLLLVAPPFEGKELFYGRLLALLATLTALGKDIDKAIEQAQEALEHLPQDELVWRARAARALGVSYGFAGDTQRFIEVCEQAKALALRAGNHFLATEIVSQIITARMCQGRLQRAVEDCQEILRLFEDPDKHPPAGLGYIRLAEIALERNDLAQAQTYVDKGVELCLQGGIGYMLLSAYCLKAILKQAAGDSAAALETIQVAEKMHREGGSMESALIFAYFQMRLRLLLGDVDAAWDWVSGEALTVEWSVEDLPIALREFHGVLLARACLAQDQPLAVLSIYDRVCETARPGGRMAWVLHLGLYRALALQRLGRAEAALEALAECLSLAAPQGYKRLFLEAGTPLVALLQQAGTRGIYPDFTRELLAAFDGTALERSSASAFAPVQPLVEPLSQRELEVLELISGGYTNQEIANALVVSLNTVKKHTSHIYGKLGVKNRTQAIALARGLGLGGEGISQLGTKGSGNLGAT